MEVKNLCENRKSKEFCEKAYEKIDEMKEKSEEVIKQHPLTSVAVAAGVGAVTGILISEGIRALMRRR